MPFAYVVTARLRLDAVTPDAGNADPDADRLVYADRPVDDDVLAHVIALS